MKPATKRPPDSGTAPAAYRPERRDRLRPAHHDFVGQRHRLDLIVGDGVNHRAI